MLNRQDADSLNAFRLRMPRRPHRKEDPVNDKLGRAPELVDADGHAPLHAPEQRFQQESGEPGARGVAALHVLQLRPAPPTLTKDNGDKKTTPAMAAGITNRVWTTREISKLD